MLKIDGKGQFLLKTARTDRQSGAVRCCSSNWNLLSTIVRCISSLQACERALPHHIDAEDDYPLSHFPPPLWTRGVISWTGSPDRQPRGPLKPHNLIKAEHRALHDISPPWQPAACSVRYFILIFCWNHCLEFCHVILLPMFHNED